MATQLTIFDIIRHEKINALLDALNTGVAPGAQYVAHSALPRRNTILLAAVNHDKNILFNLVDKEGNTPRGHPAAWRTAQEIENELKLNE